MKKMTESILLDKLKDLPYFIQSEQPRFLFIHIAFHPGWGGQSDEFVLLYDISKRIIEYGKLFVDYIYVESESKYINKVSFEQIGKKRIWKKVSVDHLLSFKPENLCHYYNDVGIYSIYLKSESRKRQLSIYSPLVKYYKPFIWLIDICDSMRANGMLERIESYLAHRIKL